jgi:membrane fusion protein (multidrug efflux system)
VFFLAMDSSSTEQAGEEPRASKVSAVAPRLQQVRDEIRSVANLKALNAVELTTEVTGRVVQINLEPGQKVSQGDVLLRLDDRQARADLQVIEAQLADARRQLERARRLRSNNSVSQSQVDELVTAVSVAEAQRQAARVRLENHRIEAPFSGVVGLSDISVGAYLQAGTTITTLDTTDRMELGFCGSGTFCRPGSGRPIGDCLLAGIPRRGLPGRAGGTRHPHQRIEPNPVGASHYR